MYHPHTIKVLLAPAMTDLQKRLSLELALWLGFHSISLEFPAAVRQAALNEDNLLYLQAGDQTDDDFSILEKQNIVIVSVRGWEDIPAAMADLNAKAEVLCHINLPYAADHRPPGYKASNVPEDYNPIGTSQPVRGLAGLFSLGDFLKDSDHNGLPDSLDLHFLLPQNCDDSTLIAACNFATRFGMETTSYTLPISVNQPSAGNLIYFQPHPDCSIRLESAQGCSHLVISGGGPELEAFSTEFCTHFPAIGENQTWQDFLQQTEDSLCLQTLNGQAAALQMLKEADDDPLLCYTSPANPAQLAALQRDYPGVEFFNHKASRTVYNKAYDLPWEADILHRLLAEKIYPLLHAGDRVEIDAALSEDAACRKQLTAEIQAELQRLGMQTNHFHLLCAYKQGYSWLEEVILPQLQRLNSLNRIEIAFKAFLPEGMKEWLDQDGATPIRNHLTAATAEQWHDLPIRFLQELYPVDDLLSTRLALPRSAIQFLEYKGKANLTYEVTAYDQNDNLLLQDDYLAAWQSRPYLDAYPSLGLVHPACGYLKVHCNGELLFEQTIDTDLTAIWNIYQQEILPDCRSYIEEKLQQHPTLTDQPFFSQLRLEIEVSEPDEKLPWRQDLLSSLDAMHEDLYFAGSDFFKVYGLKSCGEQFSAPGLILPIIHQRQGKPTLKVTLLEQMEKWPLLLTQSGKQYRSWNKGSVKTALQKLDWQHGNFRAHISVEDWRSQRDDFDFHRLLHSYTNLIAKKIANEDSSFFPIQQLVFTLANDPQPTEYLIDLPQNQTLRQSLSIQQIDLLEHSVIGYEEYLAIMEQLKCVQGLRVLPLAQSYLGRMIYGIELLPQYSGYLSRVKRLSLLPSEIILSRHHANEVSSTNSAFMLLKELLTNPIYRSLAEQMSLALIPMENPDGAAIHHQLQLEHPNWKLHIARFNALGRDFTSEYFHPDTIHTEALAFSKLWLRNLPDVVVDNHGVPSHEWDQQYSGYTSPGFKGFWLPRALLYGYFWTVDHADFTANLAINQKIAEVIADRINQDQEISAWNYEWRERFEKYAHAWLPRMFPADYDQNMINYWIPYALNYKHHYAAIRFPWITAASYTSEVADETAQGDYLYLCARTHLLHDLAVIQMLCSSSSIYTDFSIENDDTLTLQLHRQRPLIPAAESSGEGTCIKQHEY